MAKVAIVVDVPGWEKGVVVFNSIEAADKWRQAAEDKGIETYGVMPVVSRVEALLGVQDR